MSTLGGGRFGVRLIFFSPFFSLPSSSSLLRLPTDFLTLLTPAVADKDGVRQINLDGSPFDPRTLEAGYGVESTVEHVATDGGAPAQVEVAA